MEPSLGAGLTHDINAREAMVSSHTQLPSAMVKPQIPTEAVVSAFRLPWGFLDRKTQISIKDPCIEADELAGSQGLRLLGTCVHGGRRAGAGMIYPRECFVCCVHVTLLLLYLRVDHYSGSCHQRLSPGSKSQ